MSRTTLWSIAVNLFMALVPVLTGEAVTKDCSDKGECYELSSNNIPLHRLMVMMEMPQVAALYYKTGRSMNWSAIFAKTSTFYGLLDWDHMVDVRKTTCCFLSRRHSYGGVRDDTSNAVILGMFCKCEANGFLVKVASFSVWIALFP